MINEDKLKKVIENLEERLGTIRAGRANASLLNGINVECYGSLSPISSVATISIPEAKKIFIKPYDKSVLKDIEKAINEKDLGIAPTNNGEMIILTIPDLTEDKRRDYVKLAKTTGEEGKVAIRNVRQDLKDEILAAEYPKDDEKGHLEDLQDIINKYNKIVDEKVNEKEKELMSV
ncbi:MAG: ribosome recycling factor [bacterium]